MQFKISALLAAAGLLFGASTASAFSSGIANGGTSCSPCHTPGNTIPVISGPSSLLQLQTATYTASIAPTQVGAGVNIATTAGSLTATALGTGLLSGEVVHTQRNDGVFSYNFDVTAPAALGIFDLLGALNDYNKDFTNNGDLWGATTFRITVIPEPASIALFGLGLTTIGVMTTRRRHWHKE